MKSLKYRSMYLAGVMALALTPVPALAAEPSPSPKPLPINKTTVDMQRKSSKPMAPNGAHIERPPLMSPSFQYRPRAAEDAQEMSAPAAPAGRTAPSPSPSPSPVPHR